MHFPESLYLLCPIMVRAVQGLFQPKYRVGQKLTNGENCKIFAPYLEPQFWVASAPISNISLAVFGRDVISYRYNLFVSLFSASLITYAETCSGEGAQRDKWMKVVPPAS